MYLLITASKNTHWKIDKRGKCWHSMGHPISEKFSASGGRSPWTSLRDFCPPTFCALLSSNPGYATGSLFAVIHLGLVGRTQISDDGCAQRRPRPSSLRGHVTQRSATGSSVPPHPATCNTPSPRRPA